MRTCSGRAQASRAGAKSGQSVCAFNVGTMTYHIDIQCIASSSLDVQIDVLRYCPCSVHRKMQNDRLNLGSALLGIIFWNGSTNSCSLRFHLRGVPLKALTKTLSHRSLPKIVAIPFYSVLII